MLELTRVESTRSLIKQLNFKDSEDNFYSVSIVTSLKQILPQVKTFIMQVIFVIIMVLIITSLGTYSVDIQLYC